MDGCHKHLCFYIRRSPELDPPLLHTILQCLGDPLPKTDEMLSYFSLNLFRQAGQFSTQQSCNAERLRHASDADLPMIDILLQAIQR